MDELFGTSVDMRPRSIPELEEHKVFEVWRKDISSIEMKTPRVFSGFLIIRTKSGGSFRIYIDHKKAFNHLEQLLKLFYPDILSAGYYRDRYRRSRMAGRSPDSRTRGQTPDRRPPAGDIPDRQPQPSPSAPAPGRPLAFRPEEHGREMAGTCRVHQGSPAPGLCDRSLGKSHRVERCDQPV